MDHSSVYSCSFLTLLHLSNIFLAFPAVVIPVFLGIGCGAAHWTEKYGNQTEDAPSSPDFFSSTVSNNSKKYISILTTVQAIIWYYELSR